MPLAALIPAAIGAVGGAGTAAALAGGAIKIGTSIYNAKEAKKANKTATAAANAANQANIAANRENRDYITGLNQPKIAGGQGAFDMLLREFGINQPTPPRPSSYRSQNYRPQGGQPAQPATRAPAYGGNSGQMNMSDPSYFSGGATDGSRFASDTFDPNMTGAKAASRSDGGFAGTSPAEPFTGGATAAPGGGAGDPDWGAYLNNNPDVAQEYERLASTPEGQATLAANGGGSPEEFAAHHYATSGQTEGRQVTQYTPQDTGPAPYDPMTAAPPEFQRGQDIAMQDYGQAPDAAGYFANFEEDPGAAYRRSEALNGVNAFSAARGKLRSGDAAKSLATLASDLGAQEYGNWFNRQSSRLAADRGQFNSNRSFAGNLYSEQNNRADSRFGDDRAYGSNMWENRRNYATGRSDNRVNNLFRVSGIGDNAIGNVTAAGNNFTQGQMDANNNTANITGNSAINRANANTNLFSGIGGAISSGINAWGGGAGRASGGGGYGVPADMAARGFVNTPASINVTRPF